MQRLGARSVALVEGMTKLSRRTFLGAAAAAPFMRSSNARADSSATRQLRIVAPRHLNGFDLGSASYFIKNLEIGQTLVDVGRTGELEPGLARRVVAEEGGYRWRFEIPPGRHFHDGSPLDAHAVAFSLEHARAAPGTPLHRAPIERLEASGNEVIVTMTRPFALLPSILGSASTVILSPSSYTSGGRIHAIHGSGPYRVVKLSEQHLLEVAAVRTASENGPLVQNIQYHAVPDAETRARMLEAGDADIALTLTAISAARLQRNSRLHIASSPTLRVRNIVPNTKHPALNDIVVRRALSLGLDRKNSARTVLRNADAAATQILPPLLPKWRLPGDTAALQHDPNAAETMLETAGWTRGADGVRSRGGLRLSFDLLTISTRPEMPALAETMQAQWKKIGIATRIVVCPPETIVDRVTNGTLELAFFARGHFLIPDVACSLITDFGSSETTRLWGAVGWQSKTFDDAATRYCETEDENVQSSARYEMLRILHDELPIIPHSWYDSHIGHHASIANVRADPFEATYGASQLRWT